jgi:hypothetical protein
MTQPTDRDLLVRIDERVDELRRDMKLAKSKDGFARCQVHKTEVDGVLKSVTWGRRLVVGGILSLIVKGLWPHISSIFNKGGVIL